MKKLFIVAAMALATLTASAQKPEKGTFSIMPRFGVAPTFMSENLIVSPKTIDSATGATLSEEYSVGGSTGIVGGVEAQYQAAESFAVSLGALFHSYNSEEGKHGTADNGSWYHTRQFKSSYLEIPILAHYYIGNHFGVEAGIQPGFKLSAKVEDNLNSNIDANSDYSSFRFSIPVGVNYTFNFPLVIGLRYNIGLTKAVKDNDMKLSSLDLTLGYRFDL